MKEPLLSLQKVNFSYPNGPCVLTKIDLSLHSGDFLGMIGPNGGGKTTLLQIIAGFLIPTNGTISKKDSLQVGYVPQSPKIDADFPITTFSFIVTGKVSSSLSFGRYPSSVLQKAEKLIQELHLNDHRNKLLGSLSGGLLQKALLAKALMADPDLLLLDEPTSNLDMQAKNEIFSLLESIQGKTAVLMVTHDWKVATDHFSQFLCVNQSLSTLSKEKLCDHFTIGLYHPPGA